MVVSAPPVYGSRMKPTLPGTRAVDISPFFVPGRFYLLNNEPFPALLVRLDKYEVDDDGGYTHELTYTQWPGGQTRRGRARDRELFVPLWYNEMVTPGVMAVEPGQVFLDVTSNRVFAIGPEQGVGRVQILADWHVWDEVGCSLWSSRMERI